MEILDLLKNLKKIEPDKEYQKRSLEIILSDSHLPVAAVLEQSRMAVLWETLKLGSAIVLASLLLLLISGGFSGGNSSQFNVASLNSGDLQAEAQAVDIQIRLTNIVYSETFSNRGSTAQSIGENKTSTVQAAPSEVEKQAVEKVQELGLTVSSSSKVSVDEALDKLSQ